MTDGPWLVVFRSRLLPGVDAADAARADAVYAIAETMPGLLSSKDYVAEDGERVAIIVFDTAEHLRAWRMHPEHQKAQAQGRAQFFASYAIDVCRIERSSVFSVDEKK